MTSVVNIRKSPNETNLITKNPNFTEKGRTVSNKNIEFAEKANEFDFTEVVISQSIEDNLLGSSTSLIWAKPGHSFVYFCRFTVQLKYWLLYLTLYFCPWDSNQGADESTEHFSYNLNGVHVNISVKTLNCFNEIRLKD